MSNEAELADAHADIRTLRTERAAECRDQADEIARLKLENADLRERLARATRAAGEATRLVAELQQARADYAVDAERAREATFRHLEDGVAARASLQAQLDAYRSAEIDSRDTRLRIELEAGVFEALRPFIGRPITAESKKEMADVVIRKLKTTIEQSPEGAKMRAALRLLEYWNEHE